MKFKTKKNHILLIFLFLIFFVIAYESMADEENGENRVIPLEEVDSLKMTIKFGAGKLDLISGEEDVFVGNFQCDKSILKPNIQYEILGETGILNLSQSIKKDLDLPFPYKNSWHLELPSGIPLQLYINTATYSGDIDLTNLQIENFYLNSGAGKTNILFNQPNLINLKNISVKTGASTIKMLGLANANFSEMNFTGGAGSYFFDFSGKLTIKSKVNIDAGAAKIILKIPSTVGTKIMIKRFPAVKLDIRGFIKTNDQTYISPEYDEAAAELDIEIKGGFVDVEVISITN
ncbi:MAG TPA: toast rack family protein [Atribacterota bacterium]|nr:toast rack family protein [Atribacterota bacterium]